MLSYWEQASFLHYDHIVIGAGITGLNTAIELKEKFPRQRVLVLERSLFPYGASTRNAGFACMGSLTELLDDLQHMTEEETIMLYAQRTEGLTYLRQRLGDEEIGYQANGSYELITEAELPLLRQMERLNDLLHGITGKPAFTMANEKLPEFGFPKERVSALIENTCEGEIHTGKMMRRLTDLALSLGIEIKTGALVKQFTEEKQKVRVDIADNSRQETVTLQCDQLFICTNAFTGSFFPDEDVTPGRGQVLITEPIPDLKIKGVFHFDKGYYYFREIDNRILLGGGRKLDFEGETTTEIDLHAAIQQDLEEQLRQLILPNKEVAISQRWSGIMAFGKSKSPIVKQRSARIYGAFRMGGMGVALAASAAKQLVKLVNK